MNASLCAEVQRHQGCLSSRKCLTGRRRHPPDKDDDPFILRGQFVADEAKTLSSKAARRMGDKTQVLTNPRNPHTRRRSTHVMEVIACSVVVSDLLGLNTELVRAIAVGHDIGHVPFGHQGELWMAEAMGRKGRFCHEIMGVVLAQKIERCGEGLNLTHETLEGMLCHSGDFARDGMTQEAWVVRYLDKAAYIFADWNDIVKRTCFPVPQEVTDAINYFGRNQRERVSTMMAGLIVESAACGKVRFEDSEMALKFKRLRKLMYDIYVRITEQNPGATLGPVLEWLAGTGIANPFVMLALMTDRDVESLADQRMKNFTHLKETAIGELLPQLQKQTITLDDLCDPDLDW